MTSPIFSRRDQPEAPPLKVRGNSNQDLNAAAQNKEDAVRGVSSTRRPWRGMGPSGQLRASIEALADTLKEWIARQDREFNETAPALLWALRLPGAAIRGA